MSQSSAKMSKGGRIVIPAPVRRQLGIQEGDEIVMILNGRELLVMSRAEALNRARQIVRSKVDPGRLLSQELVDERRREVDSDLHP